MVPSVLFIISIIFVLSFDYITVFASSSEFAYTLKVQAIVRPVFELSNYFTKKLFFAPNSKSCLFKSQASGACMSFQSLSKLGVGNLEK